METDVLSGGTRETKLLSETQYNMDVNRGGEEDMVVLHPST